MAQKYWYALIVTENDGSWYGKFNSKANRDDFCKMNGVWVIRNGHHDSRGNMTGNREFVRARITPTTASAVKSNMSKPIRFYY